MSAKSPTNRSSGNVSNTGATTVGQTSQNVSIATRPPTSIMFSRGNLISSRMGGEKTALARPSTAVRPVGYASNIGSAGRRFDQAFVERAKQQNLSSANAAIDVSKEINPQIQYKNLEAKIVNLLESSIVLIEKTVPSVSEAGNGAKEVKILLAEALNKAKEAYSLDRTLHRFRDQHGENIFHNYELTYAEPIFDFCMDSYRKLQLALRRVFLQRIYDAKRGLGVL